MKSMDKMTNKNKFLIIGASGHGIVVADIAFKMNRWQQSAFLDDDETINSSMEIDVIGKSSDAFKYLVNATSLQQSVIIKQEKRYSAA